MAKKMVIWEEEFGSDRNYYFAAESIENVIDLATITVYKISGVSVDNMDKLQALLPVQCNERPYDEDDLEEFLTEQGCNNFELQLAADYEDETDESLLCYDCNNGWFFNLAHCDTVKTYRWWDGSNWQTVFCPDGGATEITIDENSQNCLDEWDGSNWQTGGKLAHQYVYNVLELDDKKPEEPTFLVKYTCQYQDSHPSAEVMTESELREHLKELGRDIEKYIPKTLTMNITDENKTVQVEFELMDDGRIKTESKEYNEAINQFKGADGIIYAEMPELEGWVFEYDNGEEVVYVKE